MQEEILRVSNLSYSYKDGDNERVIFDKTDCSFRSGCFYAITGDSGSGKTTFLYCLSGLDERYSGSILYQNKDIKTIKSDLYRKRAVSIIFQNYNLIPYLSPIENVEIAMDITGSSTKYDRRTIIGLLERLGIDQRKAYLKSSVLSGGEQQRTAIARSLATETPIILADEPTGNLDVNLSEEIVCLFKQLAHEYQKCVIMVTHNPVLAKEADVQYQIDEITHKLVNGG